MLVLKGTAAFFMSVAIGVLYRIPQRLLAYSGLIGMIAWFAMYEVNTIWGNNIFASFIGGLVAGLGSEFLARVLKRPATIFIIPGFISLVPGGEAYKTVMHMVAGRYSEGAAMGVQTTLTGGAIAFGIFVSSTVYRLMDKHNKLEKSLAYDKKD